MVSRWADSKMNLEQLGDVIEMLENMKAANTVTLVANDGARFRTSKEALLCCTYFQQHFDELAALPEMRINASSQSVYVFKCYLERKEGVVVDNVFDMMKLAVSIKCKHLLRYCAHAARGIQMPMVSTDVKCLVIRQLLKFLPIRTFEHYEQLLKSVHNKKERTALVNAAIDALRVENVYKNKPLSLPLFANKVSVALMQDLQGCDVTAILQNGRWVPNDIFGPNFDPFEAHVHRFHLCFNDYVVYQTRDRSVMMQSLTSTGEPAKRLFHSAKFFRSRCNQLHMIRTDRRRGIDILYEWNHDAKRFVDLFANPEWTLRSAHRTSSGALTVVLDDGSVFEFSDNDCIDARCRLGNVSDLIDGWEIRGSHARSQLPDANGTKVDVMIERPKHIGYNLIGVEKLREGAFQTVHYEPCQEGVIKCTECTLHGEVFTISDVVIL